MRRAALLLAAAAALVAPPAVARTQDVVQHLAADARASAMRIDPRYAGNGFIGELAPSHARVSTLGLHGRDAVSHAWAAFAAGGTARGEPSKQGPVAEQQAGPDNPTPAGGGAVSAHARAVDLAAGVCPPAFFGDSRTLAASHARAVPPSPAPVQGDALHTSTDLAIEGTAVRATATTLLGSLRVLSYELRVMGEARLDMRASGEPGGASFTYTAPVVDVIDTTNGGHIARLDATHTSVDLTPEETDFHGFSPFLNVRLGAPHEVIVMNDGTYVRAEADVLELRMFDPGGSLEWQHIRLGSLAASVTAPQGGVRTCERGGTWPTDRTVPRVLVYERASGWEHTSIKQANLVMARIANDSGAFTLEYTDDPSFLRPDKLAAIDAVSFNSTTGEFPWSQAQKDLFLAWLGCDGGLIGTHAASDANHSGWPEWEEIIGASFASHPHTGYFPVLGEATVQVEDQTSPITAPWHGHQAFRWAEEYYQFERDPRGTQDVHVLLSLDETSTYPTNPFLPSPFGGGYVDDQPLAWTKTFRGDGRVFYTAFGHNGFAWASPDFREHMLAGIEWVTAKRPPAGCLGA